MSDAMQHTPTLAQRITPGEWTVKPTDRSRFVRFEVLGLDLEVIAAIVYNDANDVASANAELIALAPTLLAQRDALLAALQAIAACDPNDNDPLNIEWRLDVQQAIRKARAAIALAGGGKYNS